MLLLIQFFSNNLIETLGEFKYVMLFFIVILLKIVSILGMVALYTIAERKIMGAIQRRKGPNVVGLLGLLQPLADGFKLIIKELFIPMKTTAVFFIITPIFILILSWLGWMLIPFNFYDFSLNQNFLSRPYAPNDLSFTSNSEVIPNIISTFGESCNYLDIKNFIMNSSYNLLFLMFISSINVYSLILAGWSSNSKYAFIGALRSAAQMIAYEVSMGLTLLPLILFGATFNLLTIIMNQRHSWHIFLIIIPTFIFFVSMLAEVNRTPFDLTEAEAELVAGYNVEYSSIVFSMFFLGEYSNMLIMSNLFCIFYLGGFYDTEYFYLNFTLYLIKFLSIASLLILIRATFPRYRYDQLMYLGWKIFLLFAFTTLVSNILIVYISSSAQYSNFLI